MVNIGNGKGGMEKAYRIAQELLKDRLKDVNPTAYHELGEVEAADVLIVPGRYDRIEDVLRVAGTPHTMVNPEQVDHVNFRPDQVVFVNCPGEVSPTALRKLESFVSNGGFLFTTDWCLKHVLEPAFPGFVRYNHRATRDEVVRVEMMDTEDPFLSSLVGPSDDPQWWLEASSYPIEILDRQKVHVLVSSKEIATRYGESPVFVTFEWGQGKVYHMISHFYLQRSETRTSRHKSSAEAYLNEKGVSASMKAKYAAMGVDRASVADVESAYTSQAMMNKVLFDRKRSKGRKDEKEE